MCLSVSRSINNKINGANWIAEELDLEGCSNVSKVNLNAMLEKWVTVGVSKPLLMRSFQECRDGICNSYMLLKCIPYQNRDGVTTKQVDHQKSSLIVVRHASNYAQLIMEHQFQLLEDLIDDTGQLVLRFQMVRDFAALVFLF